MDIWRTPLFTGFRLDIDYNSLDMDIQPNPYPSNSLSIKPVSLQFRGKNVVGDLKGLTEVQSDDINSSSLVHWCSHSIVEGHQVSQAQFAFDEAMLTVPNHLPVFYMFHHAFHEDLLHDLTG